MIRCRAIRTLILLTGAAVALAGCGGRKEAGEGSALPGTPAQQQKAIIDQAAKNAELMRTHPNPSVPPQ